MRHRTVILGGIGVGLLSGAVCGVLLGMLVGVHLLVAYLFSILAYGLAGGLGGLVVGAILVRLMEGQRALKIVSGLLSGSFAFFTLVYWGKNWLLASVPFSSRSNITFDCAALVVSILMGAAVAWLLARWLAGPGHRQPVSSAPPAAAGQRIERPLGRLVLAGFGLFVVFPGVLLLGISLRSAPSQTRDAGDKPSVVLISIDALRADHLGCYGYHRQTSPVIDGLAEEGVRFEYAFCPVPSTGPSHATMLTGSAPQTHEVRRNGYSLPDSVTTLAEFLSEAGYATGGFTTNVFLDDRFGFTQGFETYVESGRVEKLKPVTWPLLLQTLAAKEIIDKLAARTGAGEDQTILSAGKWLSENSERPFFLFLHLLDPHHPYIPLEPYRSQFPREVRGLESENSLWIKQGRDPKTLARLVSLYDGEIAATDAKLGRLLRFLDEQGAGDRTLIVFTADHGENMGDHEPFFRHADVYHSAIRVPLIVRFPGILEAGQMIPEIVENSAIFPTILSLTGHEIPEGLDGEDLVPLMQGASETADRFAVSSSGKRWALMADSWKIRIDFNDGARNLYDLANDPNEVTDLFEVHKEIGGNMEERLLAQIKRREGDMLGLGAEEGPSPFEDLDHQTRERLRALGYIQ